MRKRLRWKIHSSHFMSIFSKTFLKFGREILSDEKEGEMSFNSYGINGEITFYFVNFQQI